MARRVSTRVWRTNPRNQPTKEVGSEEEHFPYGENAVEESRGAWKVVRSWIPLLPLPFKGEVIETKDFLSNSRADKGARWMISSHYHVSSRRVNG